MKLINWLFLIVITLSSQPHAKTTVFTSKEFLQAYIDGKDCVDLSAKLSLPFTSLDHLLKITFNQNTKVCSIAFPLNTPVLYEHIMVSRTLSGWEASLYPGLGDAKRLYELLRCKESLEKGGNWLTKNWKSSDNKIEISCFKSTAIASQAPFDCHVTVN